VATNDIKRHAAVFENLFGLKSGGGENNEPNRVSLTYVDFVNTHIEFIQPLDPDSPISKFLQKRGPGIHHICVMVDDIEGAVRELTDKNVRMIDPVPRIGAGGSKIVFIHPESTGGILIELKEQSA
jgi:methylmalonyl-CoA epimerase